MSAICDAHKKKVGVELLYNSVHRKFNQLEIRCGREDQHPAEGVLRLPIDQLQLEIRPVGETMLEWGRCPREAGPPGPRLSSPGERERNTVMAIRVGVNMLQFCSVPNSLSHITKKTFSNPFEPFQIKWEVYFSKELCGSSLLCHRYDSTCICLWRYNTLHICISGYATQPLIFF